MKTWDRNYWGDSGPDLSRWGVGSVTRGVQYAQKGTAVASGTAGQVRKLGGGRKWRSMSSGASEPREIAKDASDIAGVDQNRWGS
jgi:hypothetical protein